jgi:hypothetical protein
LSASQIEPIAREYVMQRKEAVLLALLLIGLGSYLLLSELGVGLPGWERIWPVLPLAGGLSLLVGHFIGAESNPDQVFFGTAATLVGAVFLFVTLGPLSYGSLTTWWPVFVLIGSVAFLAQWTAAGFRDWDALFLGLVTLCVGGVALAINFQLFGPDTRRILPKLWPVILILAGLMAFLRGLLSRRST